MLLAYLSQVFDVVDWLLEDLALHVLEEGVDVELGFVDALLPSVVERTGVLLILFS